MDSSNNNRIPVDNNEAAAPIDRVKDLEEKLKEKEDLYLRALADLDNYRKRVDRDKEEIGKKTRKALLLEYLEVVDSLEKALNYKGSDVGPLMEGVRAIHQQLMGILNKNGVVQLDSFGKDFDPSYHEAVGSMESEDFPSGTIGLELQKGYLLEGELLRPSRVQVVK